MFMLPPEAAPVKFYQTAEKLAGKPAPNISGVECVLGIAIISGGVVIVCEMTPLCKKVRAGMTIRRPGLDEPPVIVAPTNCLQ